MTTTLHVYDKQDRAVEAYDKALNRLKGEKINFTAMRKLLTLYLPNMQRHKYISCERAASIRGCRFDYVYFDECVPPRQAGKMKLFETVKPTPCAPGEHNWHVFWLGDLKICSRCQATLTGQEEMENGDG